MIIGYLRVSTKEQNVAAQRQVIQDKYQIERWYEDQAASGAVKALNRPEFRKMAEFVRQGDTVVVVAIDRLGRNTIDVLETVRRCSLLSAHLPSWNAVTSKSVKWPVSAMLGKKGKNWGGK